MELHDGFIVGIFNYCDRWCERCALTSRCRVFADVAEIEAWLDPQLRPLTRGARSTTGVGPSALLALADVEAGSPLASDALPAFADDEDEDEQDDGDVADGLPEMPEDLAEIAAYAERYRAKVWAWLHADPSRERVSDQDPMAIVVWFHTMIGAKLAGAFFLAERGIAERPHDIADRNGRVKAALLGIDRSHAAWLSLVEAGTVAMCEASPFVEDLVWLGRALETRFPQARAFVRPGFDEQDAVAALERGYPPASGVGR